MKKNKKDQEQSLNVVHGTSSDHVGVATPSKNVKNLWKKTCFRRESIPLEDGRTKHVRVELEGPHVSLKAFARKLVANPQIKKWLDAK